MWGTNHCVGHQVISQGVVTSSNCLMFFKEVLPSVNPLIVLWPPTKFIPSFHFEIWEWDWEEGFSLCLDQWEKTSKIALTLFSLSPLCRWKCYQWNVQLWAEVRHCNDHEELLQSLRCCEVIQREVPYEEGGSHTGHRISCPTRCTDSKPIAIVRARKDMGHKN